MAQSGPLTSAHALEIISSVLAGLSAAHDAGFVHRDIKPENVLITNDGHIKVTDFGLARVISDTPVSDSTGAVLLGTMAYLSPEQVQQLAVDQRSDIYSCGILLYEMVTGLVPFTGDSPLDVAYQHVNSNVTAPSAIQPDVPPAVDHLVLAATRKESHERIQSAREFRDGVIRAMSAVPRAEALTTAIPLNSTQVLATPARGAHRATGAVPIQKPNPGIGPSGIHRAESNKSPRKRFAPILLTLALVIGGAGVYQFTGSYEPVPPVTGLSTEEATQILSALELGAEIVEEFSEDVPKGTVISTDPISGENVRKGNSVTLIVSKGKERYVIPSDLSGKDPADATAELEALTLVVEGTKEVYDEVIPVGKVVGTDPEGGTSVKRETPVTIQVSKGPAPVEIPKIIGTLLDETTKTLAELGLEVQVSEEKFDDSVAGTILLSDPIPGTTVPKGTVVKVVVSKGPVLVEVPNVIDLPVSEATAILKEAGFKVKIVYRLSVVQNDAVYAQSPVANNMAPKGSIITLEVL
jgi:serine/threonine-protein kinase